MTKFYLGNIQTIQPKYTLNQSAALQWLINAHSYNKTAQEQDLNAKKILRFSCLEDQIAYRHSELKDFTHHDWENMELFNLAPTVSEKTLDDRMLFYKNEAEQVLTNFYATHSTQPPAHLIHVSCTGYVSPSAAQKFVSARQWHHDTNVTHCYHMGCYASFPAVRMAKGFLLSDLTSKTTVDIVHTELCTLHFNLSLKTIDQHVVQSLFADGHAKYSLSLNPGHFHEHYLELLSMHEQIIPDTENAMTWEAGRTSFVMTISKSVPTIILQNIQEFLKVLISKTDEKVDLTQCIFAIHPGGPKIISCVQEALSLSADKILYSAEILKNHGNMSSATLPHIWKLILDSKQKANAHIISMAFGPGLTVSGSIMKVCANASP